MKYLLIILFISLCCNSFGQKQSVKPEFQFIFLKNDSGGLFYFYRNIHSITIDVISDSIIKSPYPNLITADGHNVQAVLLPQSSIEIVKNWSKDGSQKALEDYVSYEIDYFKTRLGLDVKNLKMGWVRISSRPWLLWYFDSISQNPDPKLKESTKSQIYLSTICFDQVLDLNIVLFEGDNFENSLKFLKKMAESVKVANEDLN